ncbi:type II toxin-antitoxin system RelE/ParE family toxin [Streptomyces sp. NPDC058451]|uniref:type II toxin-antitoxin system RelE family toxin n=1 Tax=Streptomyces sp. NPDC058451 TaxID=3346506 RepID=UPI00364F33A2
MTRPRHVTRFAPAAQRDLRKIPLAEARKVLMRLGELQKALAAGDVSAFDIKALQDCPGALRLRVGDYRIVYTVEGEKLMVWVLAVGDRREIYRNL